MAPKSAEVYGCAGFNRTSFDDFPGVHNNNPVTILRNDTQVMCHQQNASGRINNSISDEIKYLTLNCDIKTSCRFIGNDQFGFEQHRHSDNHSLGHTATELM
jgi:hypothetical protein